MEGPVTEAIKQASSYDGATWLLSLIIIGAMACLFLYVWKVAIPNGQAARENAGKLTDAVTAIGTAASETRTEAKSISVVTTETRDKVDGLVAANLAGIEAVRKIADKTETDIQSELGEMKGALHRFA